MSVVVAQAGSSSMFGSSPHHQPHHHGAESDSGISRTSWVDDNQPIPWSGGDSSSAPLGGPSAPSGSGLTSEARPAPPAVMVWRQSSQHLTASNIVDVPQGLASGSHSPSASLVSMGMGGTFPSRSRVSMDALPGDEDDDDSDHRTITPASSTASLPTMMFDGIRSPHPRVAIPPSRSGPVGLGLTAVLDGEEWPLRDEEVDSDSDELVDQQEMDNYMASHRAPVDATLRSMPGVVGLGDGWAGGPQNKPKRRWFRRGKKEEAPAEADPLALWAMSDDNPTTAAAPTTPTASEGPSNGSPPDDAAKWGGGKWKSRRNLFSASQRALPTTVASPEAGTSPDRSDRGYSSTPTKAPPSAGAAKAGRGLLIRSRLNFGSMVDLRRSNESSSPDSLFKQPAGKRHSVAGFLRKAPPHPLELSHGNGSTAATKSQPVGLGLSAYSSQPSLVSPTLLHHPMLRQAYARSESHLAGADVSPGNAPRPAPLIINSGAFVNTAPMPLWRPPIMSPSPLLEVEEEDEEEHEPVPESTDRPVLKRSATFGDDEQTPRTIAQKKSMVSAGPELSPVHGSPVGAQRTLSISTAYSRGTSRAETVSPLPPPSFLGRIKSALSLGGRAKSTKGSSVQSSPMIPQSPRSFQSEIPSTPQRQSLAPQPRSVGRGLRPRSRLFSRRARDEVTPVPLVVTPEKLNKQLPAGREPANLKARRRVTRHVVESMVNVPSPRQNDLFSDDDDELVKSVRSRRHSLRTSWAAPLPDNVVDPEEEDDEAPQLNKRPSRMSLNRFKMQPKPRPALGTVFPRPPTEMQQPPSLHWAFPGSYSTPMLHKFGGSTLSLALDISAETPAATGSSTGNGLGDSTRGLGGLEDIAESPTRSHRNQSVSPPPRERALSATIAALTARQSGPGTQVRIGNVHSRTVPVNIDNLNSSTDSLTLPSCSIVDFPLPPSSSNGDISSPDPDTVEQLYTPRDARKYGKLHGEYYGHQGANDSGDSSEESATTGSSSLQRVLRKQPSWSTCVTSTRSAQETIQDMSPLVTPTSVTSKEAAAAGHAGGYGSYNSSSLLENEGEQHATYTSKRVSIAAPIVV